jgi:hypothetical protein
MNRGRRIWQGGNVLASRLGGGTCVWSMKVQNCFCILRLWLGSSTFPPKDTYCTFDPNRQPGPWISRISCTLAPRETIVGLVKKNKKSYLGMVLQ